MASQHWPTPTPIPTPKRLQLMSLEVGIWMLCGNLRKISCKIIGVRVRVGKCNAKVQKSHWPSQIGISECIYLDAPPAFATDLILVHQASIWNAWKNRIHENLFCGNTDVTSILFVIAFILTQGGHILAEIKFPVFSLSFPCVT